MCGIAGGMVKHGGTGLPAGGRLLAELPDDTGDAHLMARCAGKTNLQNVEPEDLRALTLATATNIPLAGTR